MYTKCPECRAVFRVTTEQLNMAEGLVRCGICDSIFNGIEYIEE
ncbi:MAG: zinc-ribbon domain-containing protein, partial [Gammaproteobacteria bacterium]